jgi:hypothetical protein
MNPPLILAETRGSPIVGVPRLHLAIHMVDIKYRSDLDAIVAIFLHPGQFEDWQRVHQATRRKPGRFVCVLENDIDFTNQRRIEDPHGHTIVLICPVKPQLKSSTLIKVQIFDLNYEKIPPITANVMITTLQRERKQLVACTSPLYGNKGRFLPEWIEYHLMMGVEHFYVYGWDADDEIRSVVAKYAADGLATMINYTMPLDPEERIHFQPTAQMHCLYTFGQSTEYAQKKTLMLNVAGLLTRLCCSWVMFNDVDEFFLPSKRNQNLLLPQILSQIVSESKRKGSCVATIESREVAFGEPLDTFNRNDSSYLVTEYFVASANDTTEDGWGKWFANPRAVLAASVRILQRHD